MFGGVKAVQPNRSDIRQVFDQTTALFSEVKAVQNLFDHISYGVVKGHYTHRMVLKPHVGPLHFV